MNRIYLGHMLKMVLRFVLQEVLSKFPLQLFFRFIEYHAPLLNPALITMGCS